jgi:CP12 domain
LLHFAATRRHKHTQHLHTLTHTHTNKNSVATGGSLDTECLLEDEISSGCMEYGRNLEELYDLLQENGPKIDRMKVLASQLKDIKLSVASAVASQQQIRPSSPELERALQEARAAEAHHGRGSPESRVAWEAVEEVAASGLDNAMGSNLLDSGECDVAVEQAIDACRALEELNRVLEAQRTV